MVNVVRCFMVAHHVTWQVEPSLSVNSGRPWHATVQLPIGDVIAPRHSVEFTQSSGLESAVAYESVSRIHNHISSIVVLNMFNSVFLRIDDHHALPSA